MEKVKKTKKSATPLTTKSKATASSAELNVNQMKTKKSFIQSPGFLSIYPYFFSTSNSKKKPNVDLQSPII